MRRAACILLLAVAAVHTAAAAAPQLAVTIVRERRTLGYVRELTALGPRLSGTPGLERAAAWAVQQFRAAGVDTATLDPFTIPDGWQREQASGRIVAPVDQPLHLAALGWTPSTPDGGVAGEVVTIDRLTPAQLAASPARVAGRIVLVRDDEGAGSAAAVAQRHRALDLALRDAGALAILSADPDGERLLSARDRAAGAAMGVLPAAQITAADAQTIRRLLGQGVVRAAIELRNQAVAGPVRVSNVVAEIRGRERPDEWVIAGAHLDSWDVGPAAQDNATGAAMILDAARAIAALGERPRRSIRFALWGGEEEGQLGSTAYAQAHAAELDDCVAMLNSDAGTGRLIGWTTPDRPDVAAAVRPLLQPLQHAVGRLAFDTSTRYAFQSDGAAFIRAGVPTLDLNADDSHYEEIHHKTTDTLERVDAEQLTAGAAAVAATAYAIADAPRRIAPRLHRER